MTPFPYFVRSDAKLSEARAMMLEHGIQHVPVVREGAVLGMISDRDVRVAALFESDTAAGHIEVHRVCKADPYIVDFGDRLDRVLAEMAEREEDCVLVLHQGKLAGIMTTTDVCRLFAETLGSAAEPTDDDVA